jgi:hypothetical protein
MVIADLIVLAGLTALVRAARPGIAERLRW